MNSDYSTSKELNKLDRRSHVEKLTKYFTEPLARDAEIYVPSQTWCIFWAAHSLNLLSQNDFLSSISQDIIDFMIESQHKDGGYGGGPGQIAHLATSFAAVSALVSLSNEKALDSIDRLGIIKFLKRMKQPDGSFTMHDDGEIDSRASYCALSIMRLLNIHDSSLISNVPEWLQSCQTYEGGFGSVPGSEAHGGYTFCCVAGLCLLNKLHTIDTDSLIRWLTAKQMTSDGGFCGRSNKLVDSCYSYWQGAAFSLLHIHLQKELHESNGSTAKPRTRSTFKSNNSSLNNWLFNASSLQEYILNKCQAEGGFLRDKPGAPPDVYHTCYALSGLSISQHQPDDSEFDIGSRAINILVPNNPLFNLTVSNLRYCLTYFENRSIKITQ